MSDDLSEFHDVFFEEADELIESMEAELLEMLTDPDDPERINTVFRAAHSIKGGAATFGFMEVAELTHVMETLMDEVREGNRRAEQNLIDLLLKATDNVKSMIDAAKAKEPADVESMQAIKSELERELNEAPEVVGDSEPAPEAKSPVTASTKNTFKVFLKPSKDIFRTANDPMSFISELHKLGEVETTLIDEDLPELAEFDPESLYLAWEMIISTDADEAQIREVFDWIEVSSEIRIEALEAASEPAGETRPASTEAAAEQPVRAQVPEEAPKAETAKAGAAPAATPKPAKKAAQKSSSVSSIRVGIDKIDTLINLVGELVITQSMLNEEGGKLPADQAEKLHEGLSQLQRYTRELQENVMQIRMVPISTVFNRLPRMIHDLTKKLDKKVELSMTGEQTELDKTVLESIGDPLVHLVRNAVDHGVEMPEERLAAGKDAAGSVELNAYHESGSIVIEIVDDGKGIDREKVLSKAVEKGLVTDPDSMSDADVYDLLFHPGFSTAEQVSDVSGRGVGMDVVRRNIQSLGGSVEVNSKLGEGSTFTIRLPLTLAIMDGQLVRVGDQTYVLPLTSIIESTQLDQSAISVVAGKGALYRLRDEYIPLVRLASLFSLSNAGDNEPLVVFVESDQGKIGLLVDDLLAQQQVVIKSLEANFRRVDGVSGATILGNGTVALILDIAGVSTLARTRDIDESLTRAA